MLGQRLVWKILLFGSFLSLVSCQAWFKSHDNPFSVREIADKKPGKTVYVAGEVVRTIPLLDNGAYQLKDATGILWILTNTQLPNQGAKISVKGRVQYEELAFPSTELYLQEKERKQNKADKRD